MGLPRRPYRPAVLRQRKQAATAHKTARERMAEEAKREAWWKANRPPKVSQ